MLLTCFIMDAHDSCHDSFSDSAVIGVRCAEQVIAVKGADGIVAQNLPFLLRQSPKLLGDLRACNAIGTWRCHRSAALQDSVHNGSLLFF